MADTESVNCKERCRFAKICRAEGSADIDPWECIMADRFEDFIMEARYERDDEYEEEEE